MAKPKFKYFLSPGASGDLHLKAPAYERKDGGKFVLSKDELTQQDLEYLHEQGMIDLVKKVQMPATASGNNPEEVKEEKKERPGKKDKEK